jgi:hypothetical protein
MDPTNVGQYASAVQAALAGDPALSAALAALVDKANALQALIAAAPVTTAAWNAATNDWISARNNVGTAVTRYLGDGLPDIPGLQALLDQASWHSPEGLHGDVDLGPVRLSFASPPLVVNPPALTDGGPAPPFVAGPLQPGAIAAALQPPFGGGGGLPGGGSLVRLAGGVGGTIQLPLGVVDVDAAAVLQRLPDGSPSFLAVLGATFTPPIELSFGFSLDRVGGLVGVNRAVAPDALAAALRSGTAGNVLFAAGPPASPATVADQLVQFFPPHAGRSVVGPTLRLGWLSFGDAGSLLSLDVGVIVELPTGRVVVPGVAKLAIPGLDAILQLRVDLLGVVDPVQQLTAVDASLVDSHALGTFALSGDGAIRLSWGSQAYFVLSVGGFFPGYNPDPAHLPALRRISMSPDLPIPVPGISVRAEGYFSVTSNTVQLGGRVEVDFDCGCNAHGFIQVDAMVQFRPFHFDAKVSAGFDVGVFGMTFGGVRLDGEISGPGPITIHGTFTIETFIHDFSFDKSFTLGSGPADTSPRVPSLLSAVTQELSKAANLHAEQVNDPDVVLHPGPAPAGGVTLVPPAGTLRWDQRRAPLGLHIDRVDGQPLDHPQGVTVTTAGRAVSERFATGSYRTLTSSEALNQPSFDLLQSGIVLAATGKGPGPSKVDDRTVSVIVILPEQPWAFPGGVAFDLSAMAAIVAASRRPPALSDSTPLLVARPEQWTTWSPGGAGPVATSATAAFASAGGSTAAIAVADAAAPVNLAAV